MHHACHFPNKKKLILPFVHNHLADYPTLSQNLISQRAMDELQQGWDLLRE